MIRSAVETDLPRLIEMGRRFFVTAGWDDVASYDPASVDRTMRFLISEPDGALFVLVEGDAVVGMAGGMLNPFYFNAEHRTGQELFWWVEPEHRGNGADLFDALEGWARDAGAQSFSFIAVDRLKPDVMGRIYRRRGYRPAEHSFIKRF